MSRNSRYVFNPACRCSWCRNDGKPPKGYWLDGMYGRVYHAPDGYGDPHIPPRTITFAAPAARPLPPEVQS